MTRLRLATRQSALALWQTEHVAARLRIAHPGLEVELVPMTTRGDRILDRPLADIGGKGLFLKELEVAMLEDRADAAVHSFKDVPMELDGPFEIGAILERADPFDAFVSVRYTDIDDLPRGSRVGTSSLRRQAQLRARRPDLQIVDLRGNVNTRLAKLEAREYDAIILACAGLERLGLSRYIRHRLEAPGWLPAAAQGAIAVECREGDSPTLALLSALDHSRTRTCVEAERAMTRRLHGSCHVPIAAYASLDGGILSLEGLVGDAGNGRCVRAQAVGKANDPEGLGRLVAAELLVQGADEMLGLAK
ncbi:MAG TPA: hydroxymethylbilane synthase [Arenimonas sp.]|uniref:hydroxymethylbilane synthase n=1 Tax=Arenimonas sp. TaxID=1872635 RepID=UPI002CC0B607|nr:hydroxymethylbilane synthase [Arenimonas sp.]HMB58012.1 hydroxymethylbilane synthase [Arenimonas sp.]